MTIRIPAISGALLATTGLLLTLSIGTAEPLYLAVWGATLLALGSSARAFAAYWEQHQAQPVRASSLAAGRVRRRLGLSFVNTPPHEGSAV